VKQRIIPRINANEEDKRLFTVMDEKGPRLAIDTNVYAAERLFRCYGGMKVGKNNPLLPWEGQTKLDVRLFLQSLLTVVAVAPEDVAFVESDDILKHVHVARHVWAFAAVRVPATKRPRIEQQPHGAPPADQEEAPTREYPVAERDFANFLKSYPPLAKQDSAFLRVYPVTEHKGMRWGKVIIQSKDNPRAIACQNRGAPHLNNCVYFHLNLESGFGHYTCPDADCATKNKWGSKSYMEYIRKKGG
jgi:hypothetical protein